MLVSGSNVTGLLVNDHKLISQNDPSNSSSRASDLTSGHGHVTQITAPSLKSQSIRAAPSTHLTAGDDWRPSLSFASNDVTRRR